MNAIDTVKDMMAASYDDPEYYFRLLAARDGMIDFARLGEDPMNYLYAHSNDTNDIGLFCSELIHILS